MFWFQSDYDPKYLPYLFGERENGQRDELVSFIVSDFNSRGDAFCIRALNNHKMYLNPGLFVDYSRPSKKKEHTEKVFKKRQQFIYS
jgi:hypothetical protein